MKFYKIFIIITYCILTACAKIVAPTGGPKDEIGPKVLNVIPKDKTVKFPTLGQEIRIKFDEFIQLKEQSKQIVMSPPLKESPEYLITGKELRIKFKEQLANNTTYTINFGNSIVDNHEGMAAKNLQYTFSTGEHIDSNFIKGTIRNAYTNLPSEDVIVSLYNKKTFTDTTIYKFNPTYFTKTKVDGGFIIENMPPNEFILFAYKKEGIDLKYAKNDSVAINQTPINTGESNTNISLFLFKPKTYKVNKVFDMASNNLGVYKFTVYQPKNFKISTINKEKIYLKTYRNASEIDTISLFVETNKDSTQFNINTLDTNYNVSIITKKKSKYPEFILNSKTDIKPLDTMLIEATVPVKYINTDSIEFKEDTIIKKPIYFELDSTKMKFKLYNNWKENTKNSLLFKDSSLQDIFGNYNKNTSYNIDIKEFKQYGTLILNVELLPSKTNYILQLLNSGTNEIIRSFNINKTTQLKLEYLDPVMAKIKVIEDLNNNGLWDNGDLEKMILPERTFNYNQVFNVRAYWDLEQNININDIINQQ